jgi:O-antigen ligase
MNHRPLQDFLIHGDRRWVALAFGTMLAVIAALLGASLAVIGPIYTTALMLAIAGAIWIFAGLENALLSIIGIVALLPYATLPFKIVITPTFLDVAMGVFFFLYIGEWMVGERRRLTTTPVHTIVVLFIVLSIFSFVAGLRYAGLTSTVLRRFAELILSMLYGLVLVDILKDQNILRRVVLFVMLAGTAAAALGILLWLLPDGFTESLLRQLSVIGYPTSRVIRYIEENPALPERAISTTVDPNALGGLLVMIASLVAPQAITQYPITGRRWHAYPALGVLGICLILTFSRGSMIAFGIAVLFIAAVRYRKLLVALVLVGLLILVLPWTQFYVQRMLEGFQFADLASKMRLDEYENAFRLLARYPLLGVGFAGPPDVDLYLVVSSVYLTLASYMGLLGLVVFLAMILAVWLYTWQAYRKKDIPPILRPILLGLLAALVGAMANGMVDHYFFNLDFHPAITILWSFIGLSLSAARIAHQSIDPATG